MQSGQTSKGMIFLLKSVSLVEILLWQICQRNIWIFGGKSSFQIHLYSHLGWFFGISWANHVADLTEKRPDVIGLQIRVSLMSSKGIRNPWIFWTTCRGTTMRSLGISHSLVWRTKSETIWFVSTLFKFLLRIASRLFWKAQSSSQNLMEFPFSIFHRIPFLNISRCFKMSC